MYGNLDDYRAYTLARGNSGPTDASDGDALAALVRGSDYIRVRYVANLLPGYDATFQPVGSEYPLAEEAAYIAASFELGAVGFFSKTYKMADQKVLTGVGPIKWTVTGNSSGIYASMPSSSLIDALFYPYIFDRDVPSFMFRAIGPIGL